jgi:DNA-directed RNA polymerase subunit K/omega
MTDAEIPAAETAGHAEPSDQPEQDEIIEYPKGESIDSRFLFVDVAAMRAKQLRKGARVRLAPEVPRPIKPERMAMEEVRHQLVQWTLPEFKVEIDLR